MSHWIDLAQGTGYSIQWQSEISPQLLYIQDGHSIGLIHLDFKTNCKIDDDLINVIKSKLKVVSIKPIRKTLKYLLIIFFKLGKDRYGWISKKGKKNSLQSQIILIQIV